MNAMAFLAPDGQNLLLFTLNGPEFGFRENQLVCSQYDKNIILSSFPICALLNRIKVSFNYNNLIQMSFFV